MTERKQGSLHKWFHNFMIYFFMWAFPAIGVLYGIRCILFAVENSAQYQVLDIVVSVLLILVSLFAVKVRFDIAGYRAVAPKELLFTYLGAAAVLVILHLLMYLPGDEDNTKKLEAAGFLAVWGVAAYRYYQTQKDVFVN